jgi:hypothetical protein
MRGMELVLSDRTWTLGRMIQAYSVVRHEDGRTNAVSAHEISRTTRQHAPFRAAVTPTLQTAEMKLRGGREGKKTHSTHEWFDNRARFPTGVRWFWAFNAVWFRSAICWDIRKRQWTVCDLRFGTHTFRNVRYILLTDTAHHHREPMSSGVRRPPLCPNRLRGSTYLYNGYPVFHFVRVKVAGAWSWSPFSVEVITEWL